MFSFVSQLLLSKLCIEGQRVEIVHLRGTINFVLDPLRCTVSHNTIKREFYYTRRICHNRSKLIALKMFIHLYLKVPLFFLFFKDFSLPV